MRYFDAVLFDLDGTLLDTIDDLADACNHALREQGFPAHDTRQYRMMVGNGIPKLIERALPVGREGAFRAVFASFMAYYSAHMTDKTHPYTGMVSLLKTLRAAGMKTAVVSNKAESAAQAVVAALLPGQFDIVVGQTDDVPTKPAPDMPCRAMRALKVSPERCAFVGDSGVDMQTALGCGAYPVGVLWGFRSEQELRENGARELAKDSAALLRILQKETEPADESESGNPA